jgi:DNA-binding response OmpR family regulator
VTGDHRPSGRVIERPPTRLRRPHTVRRLGVWQCADHAPDPTRLQAGAGTSRRAGTRRVFVVDDDPAIRMVCRYNLVASGIEVVEAPDGEEALELLSREQVDLVLLDVMMPRLDGWDVARRLGGSIPIVFLTARAEDADREAAVALGAVGYILKPFDPVSLASRLETILARLDRGERDQLQREMLRGNT